VPGPSISESALRTLVRQRIDVGELPVMRVAHLDAGYGHDRACSVCAQQILPTQIEYDVFPGPEQRLRFHIKCFSLWQLECAERIIAGTADTADTADT